MSQNHRENPRDDRPQDKRGSLRSSACGHYSHPQFSLAESNQEVNNIMLDKDEEIQFVKRGLRSAVTIHGLDLNRAKYAF